MSSELASPNYLGNLGDGLIRRWSTAADTEKIGQLFSTVHRDSEDEPLNLNSQDLARIFMGTQGLRERFPYMNAGDFAIVEDTNRSDRPIVACTCLWRHEWSYGNHRFTIGRPEYVATDPNYRNRGLVRAVFEMIHARSSAEGHLLQAITGIPYFYRQFGYEFVLDLEGSRTVYFSAIPEKKSEEAEPYMLRPATLEDVPRLMSLYAEQRRDSLLWYEPDEAHWRFMVSYWEDPTVQGRNVTELGMKGRYYMIAERATQQVVGSTWVRMRRWTHRLPAVPALSSDPSLDRQQLAICLLRLLRELGARTPGNQPDTPPCSAILLDLGLSDPLYDLIGEKVALAVERPYAWYVRIPDLVAFIRHIQPTLEERLAHSSLAGYRGDLKLDLYRSGLHLHVEAGKLTQVEPWRAPFYGSDANAGAPPLLFIQLLLSYRSLDELRAFFPDFWADDTAKLLLDTLFPKLRSNVQQTLE